MCRYLMIYLSLNFHRPRSTYSLVTTIKLNAILIFYILQLYCLKKHYLIPRPITTKWPDLKVNVASVASTSQFRVPGILWLNVRHKVSWTSANYFKNWNEGDTKDNDFERLLILLLREREKKSKTKLTILQARIAVATTIRQTTVKISVKCKRDTKNPIREIAGSKGSAAALLCSSMPEHRYTQASTSWISSVPRGKQDVGTSPRKRHDLLLPNPSNSSFYLHITNSTAWYNEKVITRITGQFYEIPVISDTKKVHCFVMRKLI